jgi:hypothetical protein
MAPAGFISQQVPELNFFTCKLAVSPSLEHLFSMVDCAVCIAYDDSIIKAARIDDLLYEVSAQKTAAEAETSPGQHSSDEESVPHDEGS